MFASRSKVSTLLLIVASQWIQCTGFAVIGDKSTSLRSLTVNTRCQHICLPTTHDRMSPIIYSSTAFEGDYRRSYGQRSIIENLREKQKGLSTLVTKKFGVDKSKAAKTGIAFMLSYTMISKITIATTFSVAWYVASKTTGLSPLAPGNWKALVAAYGSLCPIVALLQPFRVTLAAALTKKTDDLLVKTQHRLLCSRKTAIMMQVMLILAVFVGCMAGGVTTASMLSRVPIWAL